MEKIATRESYGFALKELGDIFDDVIVLDADLSGATRTCRFKEAHPDRFINCGIAESNMMGVAAGLSTMGLVPFVSSFAMFAAGRPWEQIRNSIGYPHLNVKIAATHGGISVGEDGASHQCCEDFALMRAIPGMVVMCPSDDVEAKLMVYEAYKYHGPVYMRFGRAYSPVFHESKMAFKIGKGEVLREGSDIVIIANGGLVFEAIVAAEKLRQDKIEAMVINMPTIKPLDETLVLNAVKRCRKVIVAEEHSIIGGLGEAVASFLSENAPSHIKRIGVDDVFGHSGACDELLREFGLSADNIIKQARLLLADNSFILAKDT